MGDERRPAASALTPPGAAGEDPPTAGLTPSGNSSGSLGLEATPAATVLGAAPGDLLAARFRVVRMLGQGGMGQVYEAEDLELRERVAVKIVRPDTAQDAAAHERFRREISLARRVTHPNVCRIFDLFLHRAAGSTQPLSLVSMELLRGETLAERIRRAGPLPVPEALPIARQIADALDAAHRAGVVHRDLKPSNVLLVPEGGATRAVVTDFGLASAHDPGSNDIGTEPLVRGTAAYMAPEQVEGLAATPETDVYAFGITLYEMTTGRVPFSGSSPLSTALQRLRQAPVAPRAHRPDLDPRWEQTILRCLERAPGARFPTAGDVAAALDGGAAPTARPAARVLAAVVVVLAVLLAATVPFLLQRGAPSTPASTVRTRPLVALLGFRNLAGRPEAAWLSGALAEMLGIELAAGEALRLAPGEDVARLRAAVTLPEADTLARDTLDRVHRTLGADYVVQGAYVALGTPSGGRLRLDVRVQDARTGETIAVVSHTGTEAGVLDLVTRAGSELRARLGAGTLTGAQQAQARASQPTSPEAARFYTQGLARLRLYDALGARDWLEQAVAADPNHPLTHAALAEALARLGYDARAIEEARRARELSAALPRAEKLRVEGLEHELSGDLPKAIETYRVLHGFFPDDVEHGLRLCRALTVAGRGEEALEIVGALRQLPPPAGNDPRLLLAEAEAHLSRSEFPEALRVAREAAAAAEQREGRHVLARAALHEGTALWGLGEQEAAGEAFGRARAWFEETGDRSGVAQSVNRMAGVPYERGDFVAAERMFAQALGVCREIGDRRCIGRQLGNIAEARQGRGDAIEARATYEEAAAVNRESRSLGPLADNLIGMANSHVAEGNLAEADKTLAEALATARAIGDRRHAAYALHGLGRVRLLAGDLRGSRAAHEEALALRREMKQSDTIAASSLALASVALEDGDPATAEKLAGAAAGEFAREQYADYEAEALAVRARALARLGRAAERDKAVERAVALAEKSQNPQARLRTLSAVLLSLPRGGGLPAPLAALATAAIREGRQHRLVTAPLGAEIALAVARGDRKQADALAADAGRRGLHLFARRSR